MSRKMCLSFVLVALGALSAAGSAEASTTLCKKSESTCAAANQYAVGTVVKAATATGSPLTFTGPKAVGNVTCASSLSTKTVGSAATTTGALPGELTSLTFSNCQLNAGTAEAIACTATSENLPQSWTWEHTFGTGNAAVTIHAKTSGLDLKIHVTCSGVIDCTYTASVWNLLATGGSLGGAIIEAIKIAMSGTGPKCPTMTLDGRWIISEPTGGLWIED